MLKIKLQFSLNITKNKIVKNTISKKFDYKQKMEGEIIAKNYKIIKKLGKGAFGEIWKAVNLKTKANYAIKFEPINSKH
jgi:serine/threonine protein kinase